MIEGRTIICFASGYDAPETSKHHIMRLLAKRNRVLWVNYHASRAPSASASDALYMARKLAQVAGGLRRALPNLYVLTPLAVPLPGAPWAKALNRALVVAQVRLALSRMRSGPVQVWSFTPDVAYLLGRFGEERAVYYCVDDFAHFSGYDAAQVLRDEADLASRCDLVVTTSQTLYESKRHLNPKTVLVPHGVDYAHFARALDDGLPMPADLRNVPGPRIGFFGLIRDWVDVPMVAEVARQRPDWHFVFIGDADASVDIERYRKTANLHFLGRKPYAELPAYCRRFDAAIVPFKTNALTRAVNPIKLQEYLAAGLPAIATPLPEIVRSNLPVRLADGPDAFAGQIDEALEATAAERRALSESVRGEGWASRLAAIEAALANGHPAEGRRKRAGEGRKRPAKVMIGVSGGGFRYEATQLLRSMPEGVSLVIGASEFQYRNISRGLYPANIDRKASSITVCELHQQRSRSYDAAGISASRLMGGIVTSMRALRRERPDCVVAVGGALAVPLLFSARLLGIRTVYIESLTRVTCPSITGRIIAGCHLASRFYVQWPEAVRLYRGAIYRGRLA